MARKARYMNPYYSDDFATIYHGDCREVVPALTWEVLFTDPPYPGREDLFDSSAVDTVLSTALSRIPRRAVVFWPCIAPFPAGDAVPDAVHIWHKAVPIHPRSVTGNVAGHQYERILTYGIGKQCRVFRYAAIMPNFAACRDELVEHPTQKPLGLTQYLLTITSPGVVLDPFMGSGTTLRAAKDLGRKSIGIELSEAYCEIAAKRLAQEVLDFGAVS